MATTLDAILDAEQAGRAGTTVADRRAARNWAANLRALSASQPGLAERIQRVRADRTWVLARDGSLTGLDARGRWHAGCSLPARAARAMLLTLNATGRVACFLHPPHAAHVRAALGLLDPTQALAAVVETQHDLRVMLQCEDFAADLAAHRLWFACGAAWEEGLAEVYDDNPGLPTPSHFVRLPLLAEETTSALVAAAQRVFTAALARRADRVRAARERYTANRRAVRRTCVVAGSRFRLWDDAGAALAGAMAGGPDVEVARVDPDDPAAASPVALAEAAADADAVVAANVTRADLPGVVADAQPWVTWLTVPRVPAYDPTRPRDGLLLADAAWVALARAAGWPAERITVAGWPASDVEDEKPAGATPAVALIANTSDLEPPPKLDEYSSHRLLWESIRRALHDDPYAVGDDPGRYLDRAMNRCGVAGEGVDRALFVEQLILPAYTRGVARTLLSARVPLRLYGSGWDGIAEFARHAAGPVATREAFADAVSGAAALLHVWPGRAGHPVAACGKPVVRAGGAGASSIVAAARAALAQRPRADAAPAALTLDAVLRLANA